MGVVFVGLVWAQSLPARSWAQIEAHLRAHPDTVYVLNFWSTWCRPCIEELPHLQAAWREVRGSLPLQVWLISLDFPPDGAKKAAALLRQKGITLPAFWLAETDPNTYMLKVNPDWQGTIPYTQAGLSGPVHAEAFASPEEVTTFLREAYRHLSR